jgi:hypothetical protein
MNIIEDDLNIKKLYDEQFKELNSKNYENYYNYMSFFYSVDKKKDKYNKEFLDGKFILIDKNNPDKKIIITPSQYINIHTLFIELKNETDIFLNKIVSLIESKNNIKDENRIEFDNLKKKYLLCKDKLNSIELINKEYYNEIEILINKKIEKTNLLAKYYQERVSNYSKINVMISEILKNKLIKIYKEYNKNNFLKKIAPSIPQLNIINKIAKENLVPSDEIEKWFNWIESIYFYLLLKNNIYEINKEIEEKENIFDFHTRYMILRKPTIVE